MNNTKIQNRIIPSFKAGLVVAALLALVASSPAQVTVSTSNQTGSANTWPFTPSYVVDQADSLINGLVPTSAPGNWSLELAGRNVNSLTVNTNLTIAIDPITTSCETNYVTYGNESGAGSLLVYTLPASANGYNITNISVYGGWANNGRIHQAYLVLYSTVANPTSFKYLTYVDYNPSIPNNEACSIQAVINNASGGPIANNVAALEFVLNIPGVSGGGGNGYVGMAAITVGGSAAPSMVSPVVSVTTSNQSGSNPFTPTWTAETPDLILGLSPTTANGTFTQESAGGTPVLTDGTIGTSGAIAGFATCGANAGTSLIYTLPANANGYDLTNIVTYSGWGDGGRDGQYYIVSYSTVSAPNTYIPITTVYYLPSFANPTPANRVAIAMNDGSRLASGVVNVKFDFAGPPGSGNFNNAYQGYSEIIVQGQGTATPPPPPSALLSQDILPASAATVVGDWVTFTAAYSNSPPVAVQWQQITTSPAATNNINTGVVNVTNNGVVTSTLTLTNLQLTDSGTYSLAGLNATNGAAATSYSTGAPLVVNSRPAPVNNIIITEAGQTGLGPISVVNASTNFTPTWTANTEGDLILGSVDGSFGTAGTVYTPVVNGGNFGLAGANGDPVVLSDGVSGYLTYDPGTGGGTAGSSPIDTCGPYSTAPGANYPGISVTYTLNTASAIYGYDLTNLVVYGGWGDSTHNEQRYQVLYSTVNAPTTFIPMTGWVDYLPTDANGFQSATRTTLTPAAGVMARNVYAVQINFNSQNPVPKNSYSGYSEIIVDGAVAPNRPVLTQDISPAAAEDVVGGELTLAPTFVNATSYQWLKNGTNLVGQTSPSLTLSNLQLTDVATNGGYSLVAWNANGTNSSSSCTVYVDPAPTPTNNVVTAFAYQSSSAAGFGPTWDTSLLGASLIAGQNPPLIGSDTAANFIGGGDDANGLPVLTDGSYGAFASDGTHPAFAAAGPGAGNYVIYQLGNNSPAANGYDVTNIQIAGGWNDFGRDSQVYTILYSTVANPNMFIPLVTVHNDLSSGNGEAAPSAGTPTAVRGTFTPANGVLARNVYAIEVNFEFPHNVANGYSGYSEISVFGSPSATLPPAGPVITGVHSTSIPSGFTLAAPNLIANQLPSSTGSGVFTEEGCNETNLTDGILGSGAAYGASCGDDGTAVPWIVFTPTNGYWNLTNIVVYTLWNDYGRCGQWYNLSYATTSNPTLFLPLASVGYNPFVPEDGTHSANQVQIAPAVGQSLLASNVAAVKFDFTPQGALNYGWSGYTEIVLQGTNVPVAIVPPPTLPTLARPTVSRGNLILTGSGGSANTGYAWLTTTNLTIPLTNWTVSVSGMSDGSGYITNGIPVTSTPPASFFRLKMPYP
jgi:hypothetical protein